MSKVAVRDEAEITEMQRVIDFRLMWLLTVYGRRNAEKIANDLTVDWHFAYDLRNKCTDESLCMRVIFGSL